MDSLQAVPERQGEERGAAIKGQELKDISF
jgi:hypothetical protein